MRRARAGLGSPQAETPSRLHGDGEIVVNTRSAPSAMKLVLAAAMGLTMCAALVVMGKGRGETPPIDLKASGGPGRASGVEGTNLRKTFRRLSMIGFEAEEGSEQRGGWRTCRAYEEDKLGPHKKVHFLCSAVCFMYDSGVW